MEILSGPATSVRHSTETHGAVSGNYGRVSGSVNTSHVCTMRVGEVPVRIKLHGATNVDDGDVVTVVGRRAADGFRGFAFRNETTGTLHSTPTWIGYLLAGLLLLLGIPLSLVIIGLPFLVIGGIVLYLSIRQTRALALLRATPSPAPAPALRVGTA